jgi:hypothetical protein
VEEPAFTSTTTDEQKSFHGDTQFVIESKNGKSIAALSVIKSEKKLYSLLRRNTNPDKYSFPIGMNEKGELYPLTKKPKAKKE